MSDGVRFGGHVRADLEAFAELKGVRLSSPLGLINVLLHPGVMAVLIFRLESFCHRYYLRPISRLLYILNVILFGAELMPSARIGPGLVMPHPVGIGVGANVRIGRHVRMLGLVRLGGSFAEFGPAGEPTIEDECWLLDGAKVFGPITVGEGSVVGADSLVLESVPPGVVVAGRPARIIRRRTDALNVRESAS